MPQMAPMSWTLLFIMFSMTMVYISISNYYLYPTSMSNNNSQMPVQKHVNNWKW
uniref:ATP synthase complex subunit 8 n=1 Tax=Pseudolestes mirabilis TaxID=476809 RepID=D2DNH8_9ODON|nr:ATP synthase F0 subunit 8 [Pseudolestes mirabilis]ACM63337.1 ATP synthase F0 subunit 8 [Pseudolestes mirabilis]